MDTYKVTSDEPFQKNDLSNIGQCSTQDVDLNDCEFSCHRSDIPLEIAFEEGTLRQRRKRMYPSVKGKKRTRRRRKQKPILSDDDLLYMSCLFSFDMFLFFPLHFSKA